MTNPKNNLITTALLGTSKKNFDISDFIEELKPVVETIITNNPDQETIFFKAANVAYNYYRSGTKPISTQFIDDQAPKEELPYCSEKATAILNDLLDEKYYTLVALWSKLCCAKGMIVQPQLLPEYFNWGIHVKKRETELFKAVIGKRGIWLSKFQEQWKNLVETEELTDWELANLPQRVKYLKELRINNPLEALQKLQEVWSEENAANRLELLGAIVVNLSKADEGFLEETLTQKGNKIKEYALSLLKLIPDSKIQQAYQEVLRASIQIKEGKVFGLISKTNIEINLQDVEEKIFETGIDKLSSDKKISDQDYILMQLISEVHPSFWVGHFHTNPEETIKLFVRKDELKKFLPSLCKATIKYKTEEWAHLLIENYDGAPVELLFCLTEDKRLKLAVGFIKTNLDQVVEAARFQSMKEWEMPFCQKLIPALADNPSKYNKHFFETLSVYIPKAIEKDLDGFKPDESWKQNYWIGIADAIKKMIHLKEQIKQSF